MPARRSSARSTAPGGIDWIKRLRYNQTLAVKMGVEIQVSARSDLLIRDIVHLRNSLQQGEIDIGVIVVPSDRLQTFLPDRTPGEAAYSLRALQSAKKLTVATTGGAVGTALAPDLCAIGVL